jgi:hypothetical protein
LETGPLLTKTFSLTLTVPARLRVRITPPWFISVQNLPVGAEQVVDSQVSSRRQYWFGHGTSGPDMATPAIEASVFELGFRRVGWEFLEQEEQGGEPRIVRLRW